MDEEDDEKEEKEKNNKFVVFLEASKKVELLALSEILTRSSKLISDEKLAIKVANRMRSFSFHLTI